MNIRLYHARILTMEPGIPVFQGEIWIKNEKIVYIGNEETIKEYKRKESNPYIKWDQEVDCKGNLLMPGFKDAHTHSGMTFLRSYADDQPLAEWLQNSIFPYEKKLTGEDIYWFTKLAILEYLTSGITSIADMYLSPKDTAKACMEMGMRCVLISGLNDFTSSIEEVASEYDKWNHTSPLITYQLGFHAEYTCSKPLLVKLASVAHKLHAPVYAHMNETQKEIQDCKKKYGMTPPVFLNSLGMFEYGGGGYHCVYMTEEDLTVFMKHRMYVITNPASNCKLASGIAPISTFMKRDIPVAIGTDGPASNNCLDMFREMFLVSGLCKIKDMDAASLDASNVLRMAISNGASALRLKKVDTLTEGNYADMIMIDLNQPNMHPYHNIEKNLVYSGSKSNIKMTMVHGNILYMNGVFSENIDEHLIYEETERRTRNLFHTMGD